MTASVRGLRTECPPVRTVVSPTFRGRGVTIRRMRHQSTHLTHCPCRRWRTGWRRVCQCGFAAWPCHAFQMLQWQDRQQEAARAKRPAWNAPTTTIAVAPLLTRGQAAAFHQDFRR